MDGPITNGPIQRMLSAFSDSNVLFKLLVVILLVGLFHNVIFKSKKPPIFPVWATLEIALTSFIISKGGLGRSIFSSIRRHGGSLFGFTSRNLILVNFPEVDRLMSQSYHTISTEPVQWTLCTRIFGVTDTPEIRKKFEKSWKDLTRPVERTYVNESASAAVIEKADIPQKAASFVTFSADTVHMKRWELSAGIQVIVPPDSQDKSGVVEASLQSLVRDFGACISIPQLYGQDFLDRYPQLLDDFWKFDNDLFPLLIIGIPSWAPFKMMKEGTAARSRLLNQMEGLYQRIDQHQRGEPVDFGADMSDISNIALERHKVYMRDNWAIKHRGEHDFALLWGQNANTQPVLFWFLVYVYSTPDLVHKLREESAPYIKVSQTYPPEITSIDLPALSRDCPLLKSCIFETYRLTIEATSIRYMERSLSINDGVHKHELKPGTFVSVPHSIYQRDPSMYADPDSFVPDRFLETDPKSGKVLARYGNLKPWGSGTGLCKGRTFAEKEIMVSSAAIMSLWDIEPASGTWKLPAMVPGTGVKKPVEDVRVLIKRRVLV